MDICICAHVCVCVPLSVSACRDRGREGVIIGEFLESFLCV